MVAKGYFLGRSPHERVHAGDAGQDLKCYNPPSDNLRDFCVEQYRVSHLGVNVSVSVLLGVVDHGQILKITEIVKLVVVSHDALHLDLCPLSRSVLRGLEAWLQLLLLDADQEGGVGLLLTAGGLTEHVIRPSQLRFERLS